MPVSSGALRCASELFHPKVTEAAALLDAGEVFPSGPFASEDVLGVLSRLGMRDQVTREAVLQSARSVEALAPVDADLVLTATGRRAVYTVYTQSRTSPGQYRNGQQLP